MFTAQHITVVKDKDCRCVLHNLLHEFQEQFNDCMNLKHYNESMLRDNDYGKMMTRIFSVPLFKSDMCLISIVWKLRFWHKRGHGTEEGPTITSCFEEEPKNPSFKRASDVFCTTWSFHRQMVVSFTLTLLKSFLQDFFRVLTQSLR